MIRIAIIDFGGQYTHLIARRIRSLGVYSQIYQPEDRIAAKEVAGIILSGGPRSVNAEDALRTGIDFHNLKIPVLGICYGHQLLAVVFGGKVSSGSNKEYGMAEITCDPQFPFFQGLSPEQQVWMSHGDHVLELPADFEKTASSASVEIAAMQSGDGRIYGVQFHPEVTHTRAGMQMLDNFLRICQAERTWKPVNFKKTILDRIRREAGNNKLILLLSGGVDSLVALELCIAALGNNRVFSIHVDTGFMRLNESKQVMAHLQELQYDNVRIIKAEDLFLKELGGVTDPEEKRLIIGKLFVDIVHEELKKLKFERNWLLVQGTIYPDTIESGFTAKAAKIKTHHNRVAEIEELIAQGKVIEPIRELYKDEVRMLGEELGLPSNLVHRQPFPGPGLAIRLLASQGISQDDFRKEQPLLLSMLSAHGFSGLILPVFSVGVQGDFRTYHHPAVIWSDEGIDVTWNLLHMISSKLINNLESVNRVVYSLDQLQGEPQLISHYLTRQNLELLRQVDAFFSKKTSHLTEIWQMPIVSLPFIDEAGKLIFILRPVRSLDAMTADVYEMDFSYLHQIIQQVQGLPGVGRIFYDITTKPPGTIEWE